MPIVVHHNTLRALWVIKREGATDRTTSIGSRRFAELFWPKTDSRYAANWTRVSNIGHGATCGVGMWRSGGSFLAKLAHRKLLCNCSRPGELPKYYLTPVGLRTLELAKFDPNRPALLRDAIGRHVRSRIPLACAGGDKFDAGTVFKVSVHWRGRLNLTRVVASGKGKVLSGGIRRVHLSCVEFLPVEAATEPATVPPSSN